jgi:hypothetical protein
MHLCRNFIFDSNNIGHSRVMNLKWKECPHSATNSGIPGTESASKQIAHSESLRVVLIWEEQFG